MKRGLLGSTALVGASAMMAGPAGAAEALTWELTGNVNFQFYYVDQDFNAVTYSNTWTQYPTYGSGAWTLYGVTGTAAPQDHAWYFGVDEAELQINVSGTADNGLNYGFKIEINANTTDTKVADEARLQLSGGWGTIQMGDEDGAEDIMNFGGENLMGATGGFDGDQDDVLLRSISTANGVEQMVAPGYPTIAGDTSDATKISYFSPRRAGFQVGASLTPQPSLNGDDFKQDGAWENHIGAGANYDDSFGGVRVRASAVYSTASVRAGITQIEDISAWSVGGIVGFGPVSVGANYTDNGDSGTWAGNFHTESSYWNVAAGFETGPLYLSAGYFLGTREYAGSSWGDTDDSTYEHIALTADYTMAPGLGVYAEIDLISDEVEGVVDPAVNDATIFIAGANVSF